jgi:hypothetical protein
MGSFVSVCLSACAPTLAPGDAPPFCSTGCRVQGSGLRVEGRQFIRLVLALPVHVHLFKDDATLNVNGLGFRV